MSYKVYSKQFKIEALREYKKSGLSPTDFAFKYQIPDSTFFDWLKKYSQNECWLEVTNKVENLKDYEVFDSDGPRPLVVVADMLNQVPDKEIITFTYRGVVISFHYSVLEKVLKVIKNVEL